MEPAVGIEPTTGCLQNSCSASELRRPASTKRLADRRRLEPLGGDERVLAHLLADACERAVPGVHHRLGWQLEELALDGCHQRVPVAARPVGPPDTATGEGVGAATALPPQT